MLCSLNLFNVKAVCMSVFLTSSTHAMSAIMPGTTRRQAAPSVWPTSTNQSSLWSSSQIGLKRLPRMPDNIPECAANGRFVCLLVYSLRYFVGLLLLCDYVCINFIEMRRWKGFSWIYKTATLQHVFAFMMKCPRLVVSARVCSNIQYGGTADKCMLTEILDKLPRL